MRVLAIESSTEMLSVAVGDAGALAVRRERAGQSHSARALPLVDAVLAERGIALADVDAIAFGAGPGSFTGVRIACGIAQGLALGAGKPVVPVGTLEALAEAARVKHGATRVFACMDARMHEVYVAAFEHDGARWHEVVPAAVSKPAEVVVPEGPWLGAGDGFLAASALASLPSLRGVDASLMPDATAIAALALGRLARGESVPPEHALPLYVRHRVALTAAERAAGATL